LDYDDYQVAYAPSWLSDPMGALWNRVLGVMKQALSEGAKAAIKTRFAAHAPLDGLPVLLEDRGLDPAWRETEGSVRARIRKAWDTWQKAGTKAGIAEALTLAGYTNFEIREQPQDGTLKWFEFEVWLLPPFPWTDQYLADGRWDEPGIWDDGGLWAPDLPPEDLARLRLAVRKWKGTHARCRQIVIVHAGETWDATAPPGTWDDDPAATWGDDVSYLTPLN
jgi:tail protein P2 I